MILIVKPHSSLYLLTLAFLRSRLWLNSFIQPNRW